MLIININHKYSNVLEEEKKKKIATILTIDLNILQELPLNYGSNAFKRWREVQVPVYMKFHIFHLSNDYNKNLSNIKLVERGPYVFEEKRTKENIEYFENDKKEFLFKYRERKVYTFNEKLS